MEVDVSIFLGVAVDEIVCWPTDVSSGGTKQKLRDKLPNKLAGIIVMSLID